MICGKSPVDVDHWKTRGSGGGDDLENLSPLCRKCHIEKHSLGNKRFFVRYESVICSFREKFELPPLSAAFDD